MNVILVHFTAVMIALTIACLAAIAILYALAVADGRRCPPVPGCPWCDNHVGPCDCTGPCGRPRCEWRELPDLGQETPEPGSEREANLMLARWIEEGNGRG